MTKIKICGLMHDCDVDFVNEARPDYVGFVSAPQGGKFPQRMPAGSGRIWQAG